MVLEPTIITNGTLMRELLSLIQQFGFETVLCLLLLLFCFYIVRWVMVQKEHSEEYYNNVTAKNMKAIADTLCTLNSTKPAWANDFDRHHEDRRKESEEKIKLLERLVNRADKSTEVLQTLCITLKNRPCLENAEI